ncbi:MAG: hypothetical protein HYV97_07635 [Bdellovibrio sp.]|nr:hypothetical protein [Bdellovibrio sp.]
MFITIFMGYRARLGEFLMQKFVIVTFLLRSWGLPLYFFCISPIVHAHSDSEPPVDFVPGIPNGVEQNRAGYGWLNASSEAEADSLFRQECPRPDASGNVPICIPRNSVLETAYRLADNNLELAFTRMAQENAYEYLILQRAAISPGQPAWDSPTCLASNPKLAKMRDDLNVIKSKNGMELNAFIRELGTKIKAITDRPETSWTPDERTQLAEMKRQHLLAIKFRAVKESTRTDRMAQALLVDKQLGLAQNRSCGSVGIPRKCMSIKRNRDRIRQAFPSVFAGALNELEAFANDDQRRKWEQKEVTAELAGLVRCGTTPFSRFEKSIYQMMGHNGAPNPIPGAGTGSGTGTGYGCASTEQNTAAIARGQSIVATAFAKDDGYPKIVSQNSDGKGAYTLAREAAFDAVRGVGTPPGSPVDSRMKNAYDDFSQAARQMLHVQELTAANQMGNLCSRNSLKAIAQFQPQAIRQTILDQNEPGSREGLTRLMCKNGIMERFQANDQSLDCSGVSGDPSQANGMTVNRTNYNLPFSSNSNYKLKTLPDGSLEVSTKINYRFSYDPSIDPSSASYAGDANVPEAARKNEEQQKNDFKNNTSSWVSQSTAWYDSMTSKVSDPKVKFRIEQCLECPDSDTPRVSVSPCYRRVKPRNFDTDFPPLTPGGPSRFDKHRCWYKNGVNKSPNWQDAGNFTTTMPPRTIMHETGHNLGLPDEYTADYYPATPLGENGALSCNSTMASSNGSCHTLYARHLLQITRPSRVCPRP